LTQEAIVGIVQDAVMAVILASAPPLALGLIIGIAVSVFQAVTSIQEQTMAFIPKILAVMLSLVFFGYFMLTVLQEYIIELYMNIPFFISEIR